MFRNAMPSTYLEYWRLIMVQSNGDDEDDGIIRIYDEDRHPVY